MLVSGTSEKNIFSRRHVGIGKPVPLIRQAQPTRLRPSRDDFEARLSEVQRQSEQGNDHSNQDYSRNRNAGWLFRVRLSADHYIHRSSRPIHGQRPYIREHHHLHGPSRPIHGQLQYIREHDDIDRPPGSVPRIGHHIPRPSTALCRFRLLTRFNWQPSG
jgi:hypothetical protein